MMKTYRTLLTVLLIFPVMHLRAETVVVEVDRVFAEYHRTLQAEAQIQEMVQAYRQQQEQARARFQEMQDAFNRLRETSDSADLAEARRRELAQQAADKIDEMRTMEQQFRQEDQNRQRQIEEQGRRLRRGIVEEIQERIQELAAERNWTLVLDSSAVSANGMPVVLRASNTLDVTGEVIQALHRNAPPRGQ